MVVFGQIFVVGQKWLYLGKIVVFRAKWLYSGKSGCFSAKVVYSCKMVFFLQTGFIWEKLLY